MKRSLSDTIETNSLRSEDVVNNNVVEQKKAKPKSFKNNSLEVKKNDSKITSFRFYDNENLLCCSKVQQDANAESALSICLGDFSHSFEGNNIFHINMDMIKSYLLKNQNTFSIKSNVCREDFDSFIFKTCKNSFDVMCPEAWKRSKTNKHYQVLKELLKNERMGYFACPLESFVVDKSFVFY